MVVAYAKVIEMTALTKVILSAYAKVAWSVQLLAVVTGMTAKTKTRVAAYAKVLTSTYAKRAKDEKFPRGTLPDDASADTPDVADTEVGAYLRTRKPRDRLNLRPT